MVAVAAIVAVSAVIPDAQPKKASVDLIQAPNDKLAAVEKVLELMEGLRTKILAEGEEEAHTYDKMACFCKDTTAEKQAAIEDGENKKEELMSQIAELTEMRDELDETIKSLLEEIKAAEEEIAKATEEREKEKALFEKNSADLISALEALDAAIASLKSSKPASFLQLQGLGKTVRKALDLADALGLAGATHATRIVTSLLQQDPGVPMQDYDFHSDGIIGTLEKLKEDFTSTKIDVDEAEVKAQQKFDMFKQDKVDFIKAKNVELESANKERDDVIAQIESASEELSTVSAQLLADQEYMMELSKMCHEQAVTWDQRTQMRADELSALTSAINIVGGKVAEKTTAATVRLMQRKADISAARIVASDQDSMEAIEAEAEAADASPESFIQVASAPRQLMTSFLQKRSAPTTAKEAVIDVLRTEGNKMKSMLLLRLASQIAADPFAKVKKLIQELIERLLAEAAAEANQKGWCDKSIGDAEQKRTYAAEEIAALNAEMAKLEATRDKLNEELAILEEEIAELKAARAKATKIRAIEKAENEETIKTAEEGLSAIEMAMDILTKFYKTAAKATVLAQGPMDDAPDSGFKSGEAYTGAQGSSTGIIGMMEVIKSDFERTIKVTTEEEAKAQKEYEKFMTETGMDLAEKKVAEGEKSGYLDDTLQKLAEAQEKLDSESSLLKTAISELIELQPACVDTGMSYAERVALRESEIEGLKKAACILENFETYKDGPNSKEATQFGPC